VYHGHFFLHFLCNLSICLFKEYLTSRIKVVNLHIHYGIDWDEWSLNDM
jgi:hypothetical protein